MSTEDFARARFAALLQQPWTRLVLARPYGAEPGLQRVVVRPIVLKGAPHFSFVYSHSTRDETRNLAPADGLARIGQLIGGSFRNAHLFNATHETQLMLSRKGKGHLVTHATPPAEPGLSEDASATAAASPTSAAPAAPAAPAAHDRAKQRWIAIDRPFLNALGITTPQHQLVPAMARKWKQINKFIEVFAAALARSPLADKDKLRIVDFGAGKAYLSFALHDWLQHTQQRTAEVTGVELRADLVEQGRRTTAGLGLQGLHIEQGDVRNWPVGVADASDAMDVMIALHACDTATDHAIHLGIQAGAAIILCSPCCHKQLRPQLLSPHPLQSVFQHGIHAEQHSEMLTDSLRALLLESRGYDTQVFEFISLEHTAKNKMILAVKRIDARPAEEARALQQVDALKQFFGFREQALQTLLSAG
ncbi:MAG: SAM-dependent methyltransferase [Rubrivivax sp.]|nr:SAM-dependent methyltransferase [Rubrivivax sp.]